MAVRIAIQRGIGGNWDNLLVKEEVGMQDDRSIPFFFIGDIISILLRGLNNLPS